MTCSDCKDTKEYIPLIGPPEPCQTCSGVTGQSQTMLDGGPALAKPSDINVGTHNYFRAWFSGEKTGVSAWWIVRYMQTREKAGEIWPTFTYKQIEEFYKYKGFSFNKLLNWERIGRRGTEFITVHSDESFTVTPLFVSRCYTLSPGLS